MSRLASAARGRFVLPLHPICLLNEGIDRSRRLLSALPDNDIRRKLLDYLKRKDVTRYSGLIKRLGLRR